MGFNILDVVAYLQPEVFQSRRCEDEVLTDFEADEEDMLRKALEESCREAGLATNYEDTPPISDDWLNGKIAISEKFRYDLQVYTTYIINVSVSIINPPPQIFFFSDLAQKRGGETII